MSYLNSVATYDLNQPTECTEHTELRAEARSSILCDQARVKRT
jgi:hypothetical protein